MLSLFRCVGCRSTVAIRPTLVANYSAASPLHEVAQVLHKEGDKQIEENRGKTFAGDTCQRLCILSSYPHLTCSIVTQRARTAPAWKTFNASQASLNVWLACPKITDRLQLLKPYDFTYKARRAAPNPFRKQSPVGPAADVARFNDVFHQFNLDPLSQTLNPKVLSNYVSEMGKILPRNRTGLTSRSQRRIGKAIRRAKMMGVIPVLSRVQDYDTIKTRKRKQ